MTIKIGDKYVHTVLGYVDDSGATVITEDAELATMTGRYEGPVGGGIGGPSRI